MDRSCSDSSMSQILNLRYLEEINNIPPKVVRKNPAHPEFESLRNVARLSLNFRCMQDRPTQRRHQKFVSKLMLMESAVSLANCLRERYETFI
jgi:hypothetical protein